MSFVYEPFTVAQLWESYQSQLSLGVEPQPYINVGDMVLIGNKSFLENVYDDKINEDILNYAGCLFTVVQTYKVDNDLWQWTVNDGEKDIIIYDSDIDTVFRPIPTPNNK